uniref:Sorting nexin 1-like isoform X1 n=1 Tax=Rhizophora mucronata TaxID=61149 RepID=A0A2P2KL15_RHIMU
MASRPTSLIESSPRRIFQTTKGPKRLSFGVIVILFGYAIAFLRDIKAFLFLLFQRRVLLVRTVIIFCVCL